jgi:hypothetical protein
LEGEVPIQQYLQNAFLDMYEVVVRAIGDLDGILGFEVSLFSMCVLNFKFGPRL